MSDTDTHTTRHPSYRGSEPFVFVSYSHREEQLIEAEIAALSARGIRIKYDEGIEPGHAWPAHLADAIENCSAFLVFVSKQSVASDECQRELSLANFMKRPVVAVHLDDVELSSAMRLQLGNRQAIIRSRFTEAEYRERLTSAMLRYQNSTEALTEGGREPHPSHEPIRDRRTRFVLAARVLAALVLVTAMVVLFKPQISEQLREFETPAKREGIVVLPFENASGRSEDEYLSEGFSDELRDQLTSVPGLRVVARPSSVAFRGQNKPASAIAKELGISKVVEGSLRRDGDSLHVVVRLVDPSTDTQLWSERFDRNARDMLAVQQEVALAAAKQIQPQLDAKSIPRPQMSTSAYETMMLALNYERGAVAPKDWDKSVSLYRQALDIDPNSAPAHARLANALLYQGNLDDAEKHAHRAVELDPNLSEGHAILGLVLKTQFRHGAGEELGKAVKLNPNDAEALYNYGMYLVDSHHKADADAYDYLRAAADIDPLNVRYVGQLAWLPAVGGHRDTWLPVIETIQRRFPNAAGRLALALIFGRQAGELDQAIAWGMEARRLDPANTEVSRDIAEWLARLGMDAESSKVYPESSTRILFWQRRYDELMERMLRADLDEQDWDALGDLAFALQATDHDSEAIQTLHDMGLPEIAQDEDLSRIAHLHHLSVLIGSLNATGETAKARELAEWLVQRQRPGIQHDQGWGGHWWVGCALGVLGKREEALTEVEIAAAAPNLAPLPYLRDAACFRDLHNEPRYKEAIRVLEAKHDAIRKRLPDTLAQHGFTVDQLPTGASID